MPLERAQAFAQAGLIALLEREIDQRGEIPGLARTIENIVSAMCDDDANAEAMADTVLSDTAITSRVLRLANSPMYAMFGEVSTVSHALMILGTQAIGNLALGLKVFEQVQSSGQATSEARAELSKASLAGAISRKLAQPRSNASDAEKASVCATLYSLGRVLLSYYLPACWRLIQERSSAESRSVDEICQDLHGVSLTQIGAHFAKRWRLPAALTEALRDVDPVDPQAPVTHEQWIAGLSRLSALSAQLQIEQPERAEFELAKLAQAYGPMLGLDVQTVLSAVRSAAQDEGALIVEPPSDGSAHKPADCAARLARGVAELRTAVERGADMQVLSPMMMEILHRSLGLSRCVVFLRNAKERCFRARRGLGDAAAFLEPGAQFPEAYQPDVFHLALAERNPVMVESTRSVQAKARIPTWWQSLASAHTASFVLLRVAVGLQPVALFYGDWGPTAQGRLSIAETQALEALAQLLSQALSRGLAPGALRNAA